MDFSRRHFHFRHWAFYQAILSLFSVLKYPRTRTCNYSKHFLFIFLFHRASHFSRRHFYFSHWAFCQATWSLFCVLKYPHIRTSPIFKHFLLSFPPFALLYAFFCFFLNVNSCETADGSRWRMLEARLQAYTSDLQRLPLKRDIHN